MLQVSCIKNANNNNYMEGHSHYSERHHEDFIARFKGRCSSIDRTGHLGVAVSSSRPIEKSQHRYEDVYSSCPCPNAMGPYASLGFQREGPFCSSSFPSTRISSGEETLYTPTRRVEHRRPQFYTPTASSAETDSFSRACDFDENHRFLGINPIHAGGKKDCLPRKNMQKVGLMSLKAAPCYSSHDRMYEQGGMSMSAAPPAVFRQRTYAKTGVATPMNEKEYLNAHYSCAINGAYIVRQPEKGGGSASPVRVFRYYK